MHAIRKVLLGIVFLSILVFGTKTVSVFASITNGTIISPDTIAKGVNPAAGDFNFGTTNGAVQVTDEGLTGYVWSENFGWINLAPTNGGVTNDAEGNLGGYAWGTALGWINFAPTNGGVVIDEDGVFHGYAWAANAGWISFNCENDSSCGVDDYKVVTDWRPERVRPNPPTGGGGGGGTSNPNPNQQTVLGCTNPVALNYNSQATVNDGSCQYPFEPTVGCTDITAINYSALAVTDDGSCTYGPVEPVLGCMDPSADNYNPQATVNSDCLYVPCLENCDPQEPVLPEPPTPPKEPSIPTFEFPRVNIPEILDVVSTRVLESVTPALMFAETTEGDIAMKITTAVGLFAAVAAGALTAFFANPLIYSELILLPSRILSLLLSAFGIKKRARPWGTVYDSVTKMPLDPAYVVLSDETGKEIASSITDLDGRYGFFVPKGTYVISASKTNYEFPSKKMLGKRGDELYTDLYFGEKIVVAEDGEVIYRNIPMDQLNFDWNEFAKNKMKVMRFHSKRERFVQLVSTWLFRIGFVVAVFSLYAAPQPYNFIIFLVYVFVLGLRMLGVRKKIAGSIVEKATGNPLSFAIITVYSASLERDLLKKVADQYGRYYTLVPKGEYIIKVSKKNADESYTEIYSQPYNAKNGVVNLNIQI